MENPKTYCKDGRISFNMVASMFYKTKAAEERVESMLSAEQSALLSQEQVPRTREKCCFRECGRSTLES